MNARGHPPPFRIAAHARVRTRTSLTRPLAPPGVFSILWWGAAFVGREGIEPPAQGLRIPCSTPELPTLAQHFRRDQRAGTG